MTHFENNSNPHQLGDLAASMGNLATKGAQHSGIGPIHLDPNLLGEIIAKHNEYQWMINSAEGAILITAVLACWTLWENRRERHNQPE